MLGAIGAGLGILAVALLGFGTHALDALSLLSSNQDRTSRFSFPYKTAQLLGAVLPGDRLDYRDTVRTLYAVGFAAVAILVASAWLVPWYLLWLLPLAALAGDRRLMWGTVALSAWMLAIAVPL